MNKKLLTLLILPIVLGFSLKVFALETTWPTSPFGTDLTNTSTLTDLVKYIYEWGIFIGGLAVFISLLIGGFLYLTSAGNPARMGEAKDRIFSALIGLVLLFSIYLILNVINPELTVLTMPQQGIGSPCDKETSSTDCPAGSICDDPTLGDSNKDGVCVLQSYKITCDTNEDCWKTECINNSDCASEDCSSQACDTGIDCLAPNSTCGGDPNPGDGIKAGTCSKFVCKDETCSDKNPGDGKSEGFCKINCKKVVFFEEKGCKGTGREYIGPKTCEKLNEDGSAATVLSARIRGSCSVFLYANADCSSAKSSFGGDPEKGDECDYPDIESFGAGTSFKSVQIQNPSF